MWLQKYLCVSLAVTRPNILPAYTAYFLCMIFTTSLILIIYSLISESIILIEWCIIPHRSIVTLPLVFDPIGILFLSTVLLISSCVIFFTKFYMSTDPFLTRFTILVLLFVFSIIILILIPNGVTLLLGWDGLGVSSYLLVIYYQNPKSLRAGTITVLINRVGDVIILISIVWIFDQGHWRLFNLWQEDIYYPLVFLIIIAAITKRAQIPFSSWLPAAIAAPTPVSALVHSSTLVTAGVFLLIRFYPLLSQFKWFHTTLLIVAASTTLIARLAASNEFDLKKIIALSTLRQLGIIILRLALGAPIFTLFHLISHALFKALLFICAGTIIHFNHHNQDLRLLGEVWQKIPLTTISLNISNLALIGFPFIAGFFSKDAIIEFIIINNSNLVVILIITIATSLTTVYSFRLSFYSLWGPLNISPLSNLSDFENSIIPAIVPLILGAISAGPTFSWIVLHPIRDLFIPLYIKLIIIFVCLLSAIVIWTTHNSNTTPNLKFKLFNFFNSSIWFLTPLISAPITTPPLKLRVRLLKSLDSGWNELLTAQGIFTNLSITTAKIQWIQKSSVNNFLTIFFLTATLIILF